jgi:hypothetical protein
MCLDNIDESLMWHLSLYCHVIVLESRPSLPQQTWVYHFIVTLLSLYCFGVEAFAPPEDLPVGEGDTFSISDVILPYFLRDSRFRLNPQTASLVVILMTDQTAHIEDSFETLSSDVFLLRENPFLKPYASQDL